MTIEVGGSQWIAASEKPKVESFKKEAYKPTCYSEIKLNKNDRDTGFENHS